MYIYYIYIIPGVGKVEDDCRDCFTSIWGARTITEPARGLAHKEMHADT